jgi:hypothetical protein
LIAVAFSLLGYFLSMITALTAVVVVMIGLFDTSTSERAHHYPRPAFENRETRLFMIVPQTKDRSPTNDASPAKNIVEANSAAGPEKAEVKKSKSHKPKLLARLRNNYQRPGYYGYAQGYAEASRNGPQRLFSNW